MENVETSTLLSVIAILMWVLGYISDTYGDTPGLDRKEKTTATFDATARYVISILFLFIALSIDCVPPITLVGIIVILDKYFYNNSLFDTFAT